MPGVPNPNGEHSPFIPGVPNPNADDSDMDSKIKYVDLSGEKGNKRTVKVGEKFSITLKENTSTGYKWSYTATPSMGLTQMGISTSDGKTSSGTVGEESKKTWTFLANKAGTYTLTFTYAREFDSAKPAKTQVYTIVVK